MLALVSALVVDPLAGTSSATFCAVGVLPSNPLGSIGAHPARASIPETLQNTDNRDNRCIGLSPWDEWFRPAVPIDTARAESRKASGRLRWRVAFVTHPRRDARLAKGGPRPLD